MADRTKVRWSQLRVGVIALIAMAIAAVFIILLTTKQGLFIPYALLRTYMSDASGLQEGTPVRLNGITVGYLDKLRLTNTSNPHRVVQFDMQVQEKYLNEIPVDSLVGIAASNLVGDKFINITKGQLSQHVKPGDELPSMQTQDIPELMAGMANLLTSFQVIVSRVDKMLVGVEQGKGTLGKFLNDPSLYNETVGIASEAQQLLTDARKGGGTLSKLLYDPSLYNDLQSPIKRVNAILGELQSGKGTAGKLMRDPVLYDEATSLEKQLRELVADLQSGKGTAGKLIEDDQISRRLTALIDKLNATIDRINAGQGTAGQFLDNPQLYEAVTGATREFQGLAKDIRTNPKKFLRIKLALF
jgi:phospholipid/cholesterol/gamma-HCH transport system substrate-binding protein